MKKGISCFLLLLSFLFFGIFVYRGNQIDAYLLEFPEDQELLENCEVYQQIAASQLSESELKSGKEA